MPNDGRFRKSFLTENQPSDIENRTSIKLKKREWWLIRVHLLKIYYFWRRILILKK